jgi:TldD protein
MGCTFISTGIDDPDEIERETKSAVVIRRMTAGHADPERGRATFVVTEADLIANGRRVTPLTAFLIEIDGAEALPSIDRVGTDLVFDRCIGSCVREGQPLAVSVGAPTIRIGVINVVA